MFSIIADVSMHLIILLIILLISLSLIRISAHSVLMPMAQKAHHYCLSGLPQNSDFSSELAALVCAKNFTSLSASKIYITSGLIHLFVVSGSHLILIEKLIPQIHKNYSINRTFLFIVLLSYGLACELSPPISRCLIAAAINFYLLQINVKWPAHFKLLIAGITTLIFNYAWISSLSLQMSWIAAFVVMAGLHFYKNKHILFKQSLFFVALFPTIVFFQVPSLSVILINLILAPVLEFILFPLGLVVWFFNFLAPLFDFILIIFNFILKKCEIEFIIQTTALPRWLILANWLIIFMLHLAAHIIYVFNKQKMSKFNAC